VLEDLNDRGNDDLERIFISFEESSSTQNPALFIHLHKECRVRRQADQKSDPLQVLKGVNSTKSFSNVFSNADDYVRSRPVAGELKAQ
jgi:hypothetical protein